MSVCSHPGGWGGGWSGSKSGGRSGSEVYGGGGRALVGGWGWVRGLGMGGGWGGWGWGDLVRSGGGGQGQGWGGKKKKSFEVFVEFLGKKLEIFLILIFWALFFGTGSQHKSAPEVILEVNPEVGGTGGTPFVVTQEDCLVVKNNKIQFLIKSKTNMSKYEYNH